MRGGRPSKYSWFWAVYGGVWSMASFNFLALPRILGARTCMMQVALDARVVHMYTYLMHSLLTTSSSARPGLLHVPAHLTPMTSGCA
jgi:hypothetical protein